MLLLIGGEVGRHVIGADEILADIDGVGDGDVGDRETVRGDEFA